jgi:hypothetical protein
VCIYEAELEDEEECDEAEDGERTEGRNSRHNFGFN